MQRIRYLVQKSVNFFPAQNLGLVLGRTGRFSSVDDVPNYDSELDCIDQCLGLGENSMDLEHSPGRRRSSITAAVL